MWLLLYQRHILLDSKTTMNRTLRVVYMSIFFITTANERSKISFGCNIYFETLAELTIFILYNRHDQLTITV